ncbi:MAG: hypothetical protein A3F09_05440 [Chlamydiae bacterium RIFCSPHIGHO2_12_FULL_49_11]|nr:MAG: hypothetical protein A3F09_05440 [Chlamydiae bacterium RIFCSPHIGHO2_12_FULL_49_11]
MYFLVHFLTKSKKGVLVALAVISRGLTVIYGFFRIVKTGERLYTYASDVKKRYDENRLSTTDEKVTVAFNGFAVLADLVATGAALKGDEFIMASALLTRSAAESAELAHDAKVKDTPLSLKLLVEICQPLYFSYIDNTCSSSDVSLRHLGFLLQGVYQNTPESASYWIKLGCNQILQTKLVQFCTRLIEQIPPEALRYLANLQRDLVMKSSALRKKLHEQPELLVVLLPILIGFAVVVHRSKIPMNRLFTIAGSAMIVPEILIAITATLTSSSGTVLAQTNFTRQEADSISRTFRNLLETRIQNPNVLIDTYGNAVQLLNRIRLPGTDAQVLECSAIQGRLLPFTPEAENWQYLIDVLYASMDIDDRILNVASDIHEIIKLFRKFGDSYLEFVSQFSSAGNLFLRDPQAMDALSGFRTVFQGFSSTCIAKLRNLAKRKIVAALSDLTHFDNPLSDEILRHHLKLHDDVKDLERSFEIQIPECEIIQLLYTYHIQKNQRKEGDDRSPLREILQHIILQLDHYGINEFRPAVQENLILCHKHID